MGFTPAEVGEMSLWEFLACADGYAIAHGAGTNKGPPTEEEFDRWMESMS